MLKHIFKIMWNDRKGFIGILIEQALVFILLIFCIVSIIIAVNEYNKPGLLDTVNVVNFGYLVSDPTNKELKDIYSSMDIIVGKLRESSNVKFISEGKYFAPYSRSDGYNYSDSIAIDKTKMNVFAKYSDKYGMSVFAPELIEGNWITDKKLPDGSWSAVITKEITDKLKWNKSVGKKFSLKNENYTIVGVIAGHKNSVFTQSVPAVIMPIKSTNMLKYIYREMSARVEDKNIFATAFFREWNRLITSKDVVPIYLDIEKGKKQSMSAPIISIASLAIPTLFLLIFAFIGTFGIFWINSQKRVKEFALRIAVGSTANRLIRLVILESVIISTLAMIPGLLLSIFIYEFTLVHIIAIGITVIFTLLFSIFSAWYPAYTVCKINPAIALKDE